MTTKVMTMTNSSKSCFWDCPYKYFLSYVMLLSTDAEPEYFTWGKIIHRFAEDEEKGLSYEDTAESIRTEFETDAPNSDWKGVDVEVLERMLIVAPWTMGAHLLRYPNDSELYEDLGVERKFSMEIPIEDSDELELLVFQGKIDKVVRYTATGEIFNWERKTASQTGDGYWNSLQFAGQPKGYLLATQRLFGFNATRVIYDIFKKPMIKQKGQDDIEFATVLGKTYMLEREKYFERQEVPFKPWEIDEYYAELKMSAKAIAWCTENAVWPKHHPQNRIGRCEFESICKLDVSKGIPPGFRIRPLEKKHPELAGVA